MTNILKHPSYENDSYLIRLDKFSISERSLASLLKEDAYLLTKYEKFKDEDISTNGFDKFADRPSLRNLDNLDSLQGSIYTYKVGKENSKTYDQIMTDIQFAFIKYPSTRRLMLRIANDFTEYNSSIDGAIDVSCLNLIHYLKDEVKLIFRASDIENELFVDIVTIYEFFIRPIYKKPVDIEIFASTSQNIEALKQTLNKIEEKIYDQ